MEIGSPPFSTDQAPWPLDHIGIVVPNIAAAAAPYENALGMRICHRERLELHQAEVAFLDLPDGSSIELVTPISTDSAIARFLAKNGPGLHHLCFRVDSVAKELARFQGLNVKCIDLVPRPGARGHTIAFLHPSAFGGVLVELAEHQKPTTQKG